MVDTYMEQGFCYFDTAAPYHGKHSEIALREAVVKRYPRESYVVADKLSFGMIDKAEDMQSFFEGQLERTGLEYIDIYLLHALGKESYAKAQSFRAFEFAAQKKAEGKVKHVGFSFHDSPEVLDRILTEHPEVEYVQLQINYLDWEDEHIQASKCYEVAVKYGKKVLEQAAEMIRNDIAIPEYFAMYNKVKRFQGVGLNWEKMKYAKRAEERGKASDCIECGLCEGHCPQHLEIRKFLKDVAVVLE